MSHYRWPVAMVALASFGWPAAAQAQATIETPREAGGRVSLGFEEPDIPALETAPPLESRWQATPPASTAEGRLFRQLQASTANEPDPRDRFGPTGPRRTNAAPRVAQLQGIDLGRDRPSDSSAVMVPPLRFNTPENATDGPSPASPGETEFQQRQRDAESSRPGQRKFSTGRKRSEQFIGAAPEMPQRLAVDTEQPDVGGPSAIQTRNTSLTPEAGLTNTATSTRADTELASTGDDGSAEAEQQATATTSFYWLPLMMGLFASLAANLFFGWVAWDAHARYQDLVDDMAESDGRSRLPVRAREKESLTSRRPSRNFEQAELIKSGADTGP